MIHDNGTGRKRPFSNSTSSASHHSAVHAGSQLSSPTKPSSWIPLRPGPGLNLLYKLKSRRGIILLVATVVLVGLLASVLTFGIKFTILKDKAFVEFSCTDLFGLEENTLSGLGNKVFSSSGQSIEPADVVEIDLFVAIISSGNEFGRREALRSTWLQSPSRGLVCAYCFFVASGKQEDRLKDPDADDGENGDTREKKAVHGLDDAVSREGSPIAAEWLILSPEKQKLVEEARTHKDMVFFPDIVDDYANLTLTTLSIFDWLSKSPLRGRFILKTDSDVYIRMDRLEERLSTVKEDPPVFLGNVIQGVFGPFRRVKGPKSRKWIMSMEEYPFRYWPPYCYGFTYVLSWSWIPAIAACLPIDYSCTSNRTFATCEVRDHDKCKFRPIRFEDVTMGGIISLNIDPNMDLHGKTPGWKDIYNKVKSSFIHEGLFVNEPWESSRSEPIGIKCKESFIAMHRMDPARIYAYHRIIKANFADAREIDVPDTKNYSRATVRRGSTGMSKDVNICHALRDAH